MNRYRRGTVKSGMPMNRRYMEDERLWFVAYEKYKKPNIISRNSTKSQSNRYRQRIEGGRDSQGYSTGLSSSVVDSTAEGFQNTGLNNNVLLDTSGAVNQDGLWTNITNDTEQIQYHSHSQFAVENDNIVVLVKDDVSSSMNNVTETESENVTSTSPNSESYLIVQTIDGQNVLIPSSSFTEGQQMSLGARNETNCGFNADFTFHNYDQLSSDNSTLVSLPAVNRSGNNYKPSMISADRNACSTMETQNLPIETNFDDLHVNEETVDPEDDSATSLTKFQKSEPMKVKVAFDDCVRKILAQQPCDSKEIVAKRSPVVIQNKDNVVAKPFRFDLPELTEPLELMQYTDSQNDQNERSQTECVRDEDRKVINQSVSTNQLDVCGFKCPYCPAMSKKRHILLLHINRTHKGDKGGGQADSNKYRKQTCEEPEPNVRTECRVMHATERKEKHVKSRDEPVIELIMHNNDSPKKAEGSQVVIAPTNSSIDKNGNGYKCDGCHKRFHKDKVFNLISHRVNHIKGKSYTCEICGKVYNQKVGILSHLLTHKDGIPRPYECEICSKCFKLNSHLIAHRRAHVQKLNAEKAASNGVVDDNPAKFILSVKKSYKYKSEIAAKRRVFSKQGIKEGEAVEAFFCPTCDDIFPNQNALEKHQEDSCNKDEDLLDSCPAKIAKLDNPSSDTESTIINLSDQSETNDFCSTPSASQCNKKIAKEEVSPNVIGEKLMDIAIDIVDVTRNNVSKAVKSRGRPKKVIAEMKETADNESKLREIATRSRTKKQEACAVLTSTNKSNTKSLVKSKSKVMSNKCVKRVKNARTIAVSRKTERKLVHSDIKTRRSSRLTLKYK